MNFDEAFAKLNPEQKDAVSSLEGPVMVLAGPGTGKTQIIALRIAKILKDTQMSPHNILCLTFTESGVVAMRKRLIEFIGPESYGVRIHTFHSFCNEVIQDYPERFIFARELIPLTEVERIQVFRELLDKQNESSPLKPFGSPYFHLKSIKSAIQDLKREHIKPEQLTEALDALEATLSQHGEALSTFSEIHGGQLKEEQVLEMEQVLSDTVFAVLFQQADLSDKKARTALKNEVKDLYKELLANLPKQRALVDLYTQYQSALRERGRYDFEDMIAFVVERLQADSTLLAHYQEQFQYVLVDEYQDTNGAQNEVIRLLGSYFESPNIFVVGDDKQSIYRFQGASLENLIYFYHLYKGTVKIISLRRNYRSQQTILDAAHALIQRSEEGLSHFLPDAGVALETATDLPAEPLQVAELETRGSERYFVARKIQTLIEQGTAPSEIAVIYRNHRDAEELVDLFLRLNLPFRLLAGSDLLKDKAISQWIMLLRWLADPTDDSLLFKILHFDFFAFPALEVLKATRESSKAKLGLFEFLTGQEFFKPFTEKLADWHQRSVRETLVSFFDILLHETGFLDKLLQREDKIEALNRFNSLYDELKKMNSARKDLSLKDFVEMLDILEENNLQLLEHPLVTQNDAVQLMTAHKAKGMEFEHVFIINCVDRHWGNVPAFGRLKLPSNLLKIPSYQEQNEEERRLFFVALTRAKKNVVFSYSQQNENLRPQVPSLFLTELPQNLLKKLDTAALENEALDRFSTLFLKPLPLISEDEKAFVQGILENYHMSVTHLNSYLKCPRLFYYNDLLRVPRAKTKSQSFGTAVHRALQDLYSKSHGSNPSKTEFLDRFQYHLNREILSKKDYLSALEQGQNTLNEYYDHLMSQPQTSVLLEYDFAGHGVTVDGVPLTGKIDKVEVLSAEARTAHIVDYKTGNPDSSNKDKDDSYRRQILFYKLLCDSSPKFPYQMQSGSIDFVQKSPKQNQFIRTSYPLAAQNLTELRQTIRSVYDDIQNLQFLTPDDFAVCGECEWCKMK